MKFMESAILTIAIIGGLVWTIVSSKEGYKQNNAMIIARSIDIASTIDGEVVNTQLAVGSSVKSNELMVKIRNRRVDHSRAVELQSKLKYLKLEVENTQSEKAKLLKMLTEFKVRSVAYSKWLQSDLRLKNDVKMREYLAAKGSKLLLTKEVMRTKLLVQKKIVNVSELQAIKTKAEIAENRVKATKAELTRTQLTLESIKNKGVFFESGDASYWQKNIDSLKLRVLDSENKVAELRAQSMQFAEQEKVERGRISTDFTEEHRAPFAGVVNAVYVAKGAHVKSGTLLMQVLDCSNPAIIVPIPETRFSDFTVGKRVTVNPIDSQESLVGIIKYISSGPLISQDKTIALQQELTSKGNHAVIGFEENQLVKDKRGHRCNTARRAVVTIPTSSLYGTLQEWAKSIFSIANITPNK